MRQVAAGSRETGTRTHTSDFKGAQQTVAAAGTADELDAAAGMDVVATCCALKTFMSWAWSGNATAPAAASRANAATTMNGDERREDFFILETVGMGEW